LSATISRATAGVRAVAPLLLVSVLLLALSSCSQKNTDSALLTRVESDVAARGTVDSVEPTSAHYGGGIRVTISDVPLSDSPERQLQRLAADVQRSVWTDDAVAPDFVEVVARGADARIDVLLLGDRARALDWSIVGPRDLPYFHYEYEGP
jgi:hypothetical protein